jgi:hypothetical protein
VLTWRRLWTLKATTAEFLARLVGSTGRKSYAKSLLFLRYALGATMLAVVVSDVAECQPIAKYWQVVPDPGGQCRQGYAQLLTMAVCSVATDLTLVAFPVPLVLSIRISTKRKIFLVILFCLGLLTVCVTIYRVPQIILAHGDQVTRSMWASVELLVATTVANAVALGSFARGRGVKKNKFNRDSTNMTGRQHGDGAVKTVSFRVVTERWGADPLGTETTCRASTTVAKGGGSGSKSSADGAIGPTRSRDSLIPRDQLAPPPEEKSPTSHQRPLPAVPPRGNGMQRGSVVPSRAMESV